MPNAWIQRNLLQSVLILGIICGLSGICLTANLSAHPDFLRSPEVLDNSCFDEDGKPWLGKIPHSTTCSMYFVCTDEESIPRLPIAINHECPGGLQYDMMKCDCFAENVICFDPSIPEHSANRLNCAKPIPGKPHSDKN